MQKFTKIACLLILGSSIAMGCGDDDDGDDTGGGGNQLSCTFEDQGTCQTGPGGAEAEAGCTAFGGKVGACSSTGVLGTCATEDEGVKSTITYYQGDNYADAAAAEEDCEFEDGTFTAK